MLLVGFTGETLEGREACSGGVPQHRAPWHGEQFKVGRCLGPFGAGGDKRRGAAVGVFSEGLTEVDSVFCYDYRELSSIRLSVRLASRPAAVSQQPGGAFVLLGAPAWPWKEWKELILRK